MLVAECLVFINGKIFKELPLPASVPRILIVHFQKTGQHAHGKSFPESSGPQNLKHPCSRVQKLLKIRSLINADHAVTDEIFKIGYAYRKNRPGGRCVLLNCHIRSLKAQTPIYAFSYWSAVNAPHS